MKIKQEPDVRFPAFNDDWKEYKADSIFYSVSDKNYPELPVLSASQEKGMVFRKDIGIDIQYDENSTKTYKRVIPGQFVIHLRSFQGGFAFSDIEGITSPAYTVLDFKNKDIHDSYFWKSILTSKNFIKRLETVTYGIRDGRSISFNDFSTLKFKVPNYSEQLEISSFFKTIDNLLIYRQQELATLKQIKQGFLQKMFPKEGESVPELRCPGFINKWEIFKVSDVANMFNNLRVPVTASDRIKGATPYYGANGIQDYVEGYTHDGEFVLIAEDGASDLINYPVKYVSGKVWVNNHAHVLSGKKGAIDNYFLATRINFMNIVPYLVGGGRTKLNGETLKKIPIKMPSFEEQIKIGDFFKQLDEVIALHQQELDALKQTKKAFLQKMFI
ncbi:MAG: restriction endonuclease subunit S [Planococcus donghaensis]